MASGKRSWQLWLGILVSLAAFWYAAREVDRHELAAAFARADYAWLLPAVPLMVLGQVARTWRWRLLYHRATRPPWRETFAALCVGYLVSTVFPFRLGDPIRAWAVGRSTRAGFAEALATVMVERVLDLLAVVVLLAWVAPVITAARLAETLGPGPWDRADGLRWLTLGVVLACYVVLAVLATAGHRSDPLLERLMAALRLSEPHEARIRAAWSGLVDGLSPLRRPSRALGGLFASLVVWMIGAVANWLIMLAFHLDLGLSTAVFMMCAVAFAAILPSTPGYLGIFQWAVVWSLDLAAKVPHDAALAFALVAQAVTIAVLLILGPIGLRMLGLTSGELRRRVMSQAQSESG